MGVLPKSSFGYNLKGFMITGGPVKSDDQETRDHIEKIIEKYYGGYIDKTKYALAIEEGKMQDSDKEAYLHFHTILIAKDGHQIKWKKTCCEALKKICTPDGHRQVNCQANHSREQKKGESTHSILLKYLTDPKKIKDTDGNITLGANFAKTKDEHHQDVVDAVRIHGLHSKEHKMALLEYAISVVDDIRCGKK